VCTACKYRRTYTRGKAKESEGQCKDGLVKEELVQDPHGT